MVRNLRRSRVLLFVAIALAGMMAAPFDACDDYAHLVPRAAQAHAGLSGDTYEDPHVTSGDGAIPPHFCSCIVCDLTTGESFPPGLPSLPRGAIVAPSPAVAISSVYLPDIFHPPIA